MKTLLHVYKTLFVLGMLFLALQEVAYGQSANIRSGNMFVTYRDLEFKDHPLDLSIERTYNSKSVYKGWFGNGWSNYFETNLLVIPGGAIALLNYGDGAKYIYEPRVWDQQDIALNVQKLVRFAQSEGKVATAEEIAALQKLLKDDQEKLINEWRKYVQTNPNEMLQLKPGTKVRYIDYGGSVIEVLPEGFSLTKASGSIDYFDNKGRLLKVTDGTGNELQLEYANELKPIRISDNLGNKIDLQFENGVAKQITANYTDGTTKKSQYEYDKSGSNLILTIDADGNRYVYEWDNYYNMVGIKYDDGRKARIEYDPETFFVTSIERKNGERVTYAYPQKSDDEYGTVYAAYDSTGKLTENMSNWWVYKTTDLGKRWLYKWQTVINADSTMGINNERTDMPDTVYHNNGVYYTYQYNNKNELQEIFMKGKGFLSFEVKNGKLLTVVSPKTTYTAVYKDDRVEKLIAADKTTIPLPLTELTHDPKGYKADIKGFGEGLEHTYYWYELQVGK